MYYESIHICLVVPILLYLVRGQGITSRRKATMMTFVTIFAVIRRVKSSRSTEPFATADVQ